MNTITRQFLLSVLFSLLHVGNVAIAQELISEIPLKDQINIADNVVEGEVVNSESFWDEGNKNIFTRHRVKVYKSFKGNISNEIDVITRGGVVGLEAEIVSNALELGEGDYGVFILNDDVNSNFQIGVSCYKPLSNIQSFYKYSPELNRVANIFRSFHGITNNFYDKVEKAAGQEMVHIQDSNFEFNANTISNRNSAITPVITSFSSTNTTAGTKTIITVNGNGFGSTEGTIGFSDANYGGVLYYDVSSAQILSWTDTSIQVEIPDRAGTGTVRVINSSSQTGYSSNNLIVDFAQINLDYNNVAYQTQHINSNSNGGFTWQLNTDFNTTNAVDPFNRALNTWSCDSGINWEVSNTTTSADSSVNDDINVVAFDTTSPLPPGVLGRCTSRYSGCVEGGQVKWFVEEMDIIFNSGINWNFSSNPPSGGQVDFESVAVHELGHGQQLGHVINNSEVMHYSISANTELRDLSTNDVLGANDIHDRSANTTICGQLTMEDSNCSTLSSNEFSIVDSISIYPNPVTSGTLNIKTGYNLYVNNVKIYSVLGKLITNIEFSTYNSTNQIDVSEFRNGVYLITLTTNKGSINKKLIVK